MKRIWIDLLNPSHPHFFKALDKEIGRNNTIQYTARRRGETVGLARQFHLDPKIIGKDFEKSIMKASSYFLRTQLLTILIKN